MDRDERNQLKKENSNEFIMNQFLIRISAMMTQKKRLKELQEEGPSEQKNRNE